LHRANLLDSSKVNQHDFAIRVTAHQIVWLDIPMNDIFLMD
jgi:hypothetical protein